jgi:hypothetical protein
MKRLNVLLAAACLFAAPAWAQPDLEAFRGMKPTTRPVCEAKCNRLQFGENTHLVEQEARISQIRYQMKLETDPDKLKLLREQEEQLSERRQRYVARMCKQICAHNPEN